MKNHSENHRRSGRLACFGGVNMDLHIQSSVPVILHDSNPGKIHTSPGGVMRNIAENCARLGCAPVLLSAVGEDALGDRIRSYSEKAGVDVSRLFLHADCPTSCYMAFLDESGDMLVAANDMRIMDLIPDSYLPENADVLRDADAVLCDANPPAERIAQLAELAGDTPIFADPVSVTKAEKLRPVLGRLHTLKPNRIEAELLSGIPIKDRLSLELAASKLLTTGLQRVCISLGGEGVYCAWDTERCLAPCPPTRLVNASGGGDAMMAGFVRAFLDGLPIDETARFALACSALAVESPETVNPTLSLETVLQKLEEPV